MEVAGPIRLIRLGRTEAALTQAAYHAVAETMTAATPDTILVCRPDAPYLCLGYHQAVDAVLDRAECARRGLPILRRRIGGGATYLDSNQLFYQCVFHASRVPAVSPAVFAMMLAAPVAALRRLGLDAVLSGVNEIEVGTRRIAGTGGGQIQEAMVVVGNLLFDFDYETMAQVWRVPSESFRDLARSALRDQVTTLDRLLGAAAVPVPAVEELLLQEYARTLGRPLQAGELGESELLAARVIAAELASDEYLALHAERAAQNRPLKISARVAIHAGEVDLDGARVRVSLCVRDDVIEAACVERAGPRARAVEQALCGAPVGEWQTRFGRAGSTQGCH